MKYIKLNEKLKKLDEVRLRMVALVLFERHHTEEQALNWVNNMLSKQ